MKKDSKKQALNRMNYLIGHLQANRQMISNDKYCIDIIRQNNAVIAALKKVNDVILSSHLDTCATTAIKDGDLKKREHVLNELLEIYEAK
jgi:DNA-binding FrmR family transcriptional regulator